MTDTPLPETGNLPPTSNPEVVPLSTGDERTWAMLAHLSVLINLVTGFVGPIAALVIYLVYQNRSRYVAYHALQSFVNQLVWWVGGGTIIGLTWAATGLLSFALIGLLCIPFACVITLMPLWSLVAGVWGAIETNAGRDFKYWLVGDWVRGTLTG